MRIPSALFLSGTRYMARTRAVATTMTALFFSLFRSAAGLPSMSASFNTTSGEPPIGNLVLSGSTLFTTTKTAEPGHTRNYKVSLPVTGGTPKALVQRQLVRTQTP